MNADSLMWRIVDGQLIPTRSSTMRLEKHVEDLVESDPSCLGKPLLLIGSQGSITKLGGPDKLAIDATGELNMIEFKRAEANRDTIGQVMEYISWIETLSTDEILAIFSRYRPDTDFAEVG